ncbi:MAG: bifunctional hydroxymethylpyrimidine kinase/phosphomethylpyrimidine kinase [Deltaproteobacteria bacterium]|nr:bifunctional hydroxymethylpyrimidine kinase/phosphomethylpyrimidine kinase [Deltaproteobacteria bacterium]
MAAKFIKTVLTIAGSDPSGGAGIQADLKTFQRLKVYGGAVITNLTIQNTRGVKTSYPVASHIVGEQISAVLDDLNVSHIKIGMIGTAKIARAVGRALTEFQGEIIYDPVMVSSSGLSLLENQGQVDAISDLLERATVLTPNLGELDSLSGQECQTTAEARAAAGSLFHLPRLRAVILKGGHLKEDNELVTDYLFLAADPGISLRTSHPRIATVNSHGTGCTFAAAFAAYHLHCNDYEQAFRQSSAFVWRLLKESRNFKIGHGNGGLIHYM